MIMVKVILQMSSQSLNYAINYIIMNMGLITLILHYKIITSNQTCCSNLRLVIHFGPRKKLFVANYLPSSP